MTYTIISRICESLLNPAGRFRTLKRIEPQLDHTGRPIFHFSSCTADFAVRISGCPHLLKIPLSAALPRIREASPPAPDQTPFIAPVSFLERELLVFDAAGRPERLDVLAEAVPEGLPLRTFIRTNLHSYGMRGIRNLLSSLATTFDALETTGTVHGHIRTGNVTVADGKIILSGYIHGHGRDAANDRQALLLLSLLSYLTGCAPSLFHRLWRHMPAGELETLLRFVQLQAEFGRHETLLDSALTLSGTACPEPLYTSFLLHGISTMPFIRVPLLEELLAESEEAPRTDLARDVSVPYYFSGNEGCDASPFPEYNPHPTSYPSIPPTAPPGAQGTPEGTESSGVSAAFYEGRAALAATTGFGLIDNRGNYIMEPAYEALEWYGPDNVAAACRDGRWNLYDRMGRQLTAEGYEWIAEPSEGLCVVKQGGKFGYIDVSGRYLTRMRFDEAFSFRDGKALVAIRGEAYCIDRDGKKIVDSTL